MGTELLASGPLERRKKKKDDISTVAYYWRPRDIFCSILAVPRSELNYDYCRREATEPCRTPGQSSKCVRLRLKFGGRYTAYIMIWSDKFEGNTTVQGSGDSDHRMFLMRTSFLTGRHTETSRYVSQCMIIYDNM